MKLIAALLLSLASMAAGPAVAAEPAPLPVLDARLGEIAAGKRFVSVAFHDVVDEADQLDGDAITTDRLIAFFDLLRGAGWTAITLEDVDAAGRGTKPLPEKAILITFDDGYASLYTRVYPLALAYRMPVVAALKGAWLTPPPGAMVRYGDHEVPREHFVSWEQVREMARSGWVEIASHSNELHRGVLANPQGNTMPAAVTRLYADETYEDDATYRQRLQDDMKALRELFTREIGRPPRTMVWPYGRYSASAVEAAQSAGFRFALTLDPEPADAARPMALARYLPNYNPSLATIENSLRFTPRLPTAQRLVCVDPASIWAEDAATTDEHLGRLIERLRALGSTAVVLDAAVQGADGHLVAAWFPTGTLPLRADLLSRLAWQLQTRGGVRVFLRLPVAAAGATPGFDAARVRALFADLGAHVPASGLYFDDAPGLAALDLSAVPGIDDIGMPWQVQRLRHALDPGRLPPADALALQAFREVELARPGLQLALLAPAGALSRSSAVADLTLFATAPDAASARGAVQRLGAERGPGINTPRRTGLWLVGDAPPAAAELSAAMRGMQVGGGTVLGWCPDDAVAKLPAAALVAPDVSASTFPLKF